jgi:very-short-patch-repair endonuclease
MELMGQIVAMKLPTPETEYRFALHHVGPGKDLRKRIQDAGLKDWRFDFAWPVHRLAVEVEGGAFLRGGGRHNRGVGFREDAHKYHHAMRLGWTVYRCEGSLIRGGHAVALVEKLLHARDQ